MANPFAAACQAGNAAAAAGNWDDALELYSDALALGGAEENPHVHAVLLANRAQAALELDMFRKALGDSEKALALAPNYATAALLLGAAQAGRGQLSTAMKTWNNALSLPTSITEYRALQAAIAQEQVIDPSFLSTSPASQAIHPSSPSPPSHNNPNNDNKDKFNQESKSKAETATTLNLNGASATPSNNVTPPSSMPSLVPVKDPVPIYGPARKENFHSTASTPITPLHANSPLPPGPSHSSAATTPAARSTVPVFTSGLPPDHPDAARPDDESQPGLNITSKGAQALAASGGHVNSSAPGTPGGLTPESEGVAEAVAAVAQQGIIVGAVGTPQVDEQIALGYLHVNTGRFKEAVDIFDNLLKGNPGVVAAHLGRGTAKALSGALPDAVQDFTAGIQADPSNTDAYKRRGQARAALGDNQGALDDLTKAVSLSPSDADVLHQRGLIYHKMAHYRRGAADFRAVVAARPDNKIAWNFLGLCENAIGACDSAIAAYKRTTELEDGFKEGFANIGQAYKDLGQAKGAFENFNRALSIDPSYVHAYHMRGMARYGVGDIVGALADLSSAVALEPGALEVRHMRGVANHCLGRWSAAIADFSAVVAIKSTHVSWFHRECARFHAAHADMPLNSFNMDTAMDPYFKEAWCKKLDPASLIGYKGQPQAPASNREHDVSPSAGLNPTPGLNALFEAADRIGAMLQYRTPGFLANIRQHRMAGLAVLDIAQSLDAVWSTTTPAPAPAPAASEPSSRPFGYRDMYDLAIKWRQYSEPNDPVWWVDLLSPEQFAEGFGSQTPLITGQLHVVRYYPYFARALSVMKELIVAQCKPSPAVHAAIAGAKDADELYQLMQRDFWVVTPCKSSSRPGKVMEGTRLTIVAHPPEGYDFSIRTPGTPPRHREYDAELTWVWNRLSDEVRRLKAGTDTDQTIRQARVSKAHALALTMSFYWYNFMPLSRGTAATGFVGLMAMLLATGFEVREQVTEGMQLDWEAILRSTPEEFITVVSPWLSAAARPSNLLANLPNVQSVFPTIRSIILGLNARKVAPSS